MDNVKRQILNNSESASRVNLIIILLFITLFLIIGVASIGFSLTNNNGSSELKDFIKGATVTDMEGHPITDGTLYVGEKYHIKLEFKEDGAQTLQFEPNESNQLTYQIPKNFSVEKAENLPLKVKIGDEERNIGTYSIDEEGNLTIDVTEEGKAALNSSTDVSLVFDVTVTAQPNPDGTDDNVHFGDVDGDFEFNISNDAKVDVEKQGYYTEDIAEEGKNPTGGTISYTVKTTVEHGEVHDATIRDTLTPPQNKGFELKFQQESVEVMIKRTIDGEEQTITLNKGDYELKIVDEEKGNTNNQVFELKITKEEYNPLKDGDIVLVTYDYHVDYKDGSDDVYWDTIKNNVTVKGTSKFKNPSTQEEEQKEIEETRDNEVGVSRTPVDGGRVVKDVEYNAQDNKLQYTIYAVIPHGDWNPFFITDQINVTIDGVTYSLKEFKKDGRVGDISVSALELTEDQKKMSDSTNGSDLIKKFKEIQDKSKPLSGFDFDNIPEEYKPDNMDQYVYKREDSVLHIIFGLEEKEQHENDYWGRWGHYKHEKDRLIIVKYSLDLKEGNITLINGSTKEEISKSVDEVLHPGITNYANLRYGGYYPGYTTFYTNAEKIVKKGVFDKKTNTIDYTVSLNTTDGEIKEYLAKITDNWNKEVGEEHHWDYNASMQAEFYDILPEGWEYVENSLEAITVSWGQEQHWPYQKSLGDPVKQEKINDKMRNVIAAPIIYFRNVDGNGTNHEMHTEIFKSNEFKSLTFHYKIRATEKYLADNASIDEAVLVHNEAMIKDNKETKWKAETDVDYFPTRLFKEAEQEGNSNLMHFTLRVNPNSVDLNKDNNYLIVNDKSEGIQVILDTIKVLDVNEHELTKKENITLSEDISDSEWGMVLSTEDENNRHFRLKVPDKKYLIIKYDAYIENTGESVGVSNSASIDGLAESNTGYQGSLRVDNIYGAGDGSTYELTFEKVDKDQTSKKLKGAKFKYCIVIKKDSTLQKTVEYTIGGKKYECHGDPKWEFETDSNGQYKIKKEDDWDLEPDNYYILEETESPEGYMPSDPILFYYGTQNNLNKEENPTALVVLPNNKLTIKNEPVPYHIPATGGIGLKIFYTIGFLLTVLSLSLIWRRIRLKPTK